MFGEEAGYLSQEKRYMSEERKALIDAKVQEILNESKKRVNALLQSKEREVRDISINLYKYDYLNQDEIEKIMKGKKLDKENVREFDSTIDEYIIKFWVADLLC